MSVLRTFRDGIREISPPWLRRGNAEKILYSVAYHLDAAIDQTVASVKLRFPGLYSYDSLPYLSRDRRIPRGQSESDATFAGRLLGWWDSHRRRGNPYMLLQQLHAHFAPNNFPIELIYASGRRYLMDVNGAITWDDVEFVPPGDPQKWARWWLFYHAPELAVDVTWDDPAITWDDGRVWDSGLSPQQVGDLRLIPDMWNAAHPFGKIILLDEGEEWDTYDPGEWPRQIGLTIAMTDPLTPVPADEADQIVPPEAGLPVAAGVVHAALQKVANTLAWLTESRAHYQAKCYQAAFQDLAETVPGQILNTAAPTLSIPAYQSGGSGDTWVYSNQHITLPQATPNQDRGVFEITIHLVMTTNGDAAIDVELINNGEEEDATLRRFFGVTDGAEADTYLVTGNVFLDASSIHQFAALRFTRYTSTEHNASIIGTRSYFTIKRIGGS